MSQGGQMYWAFPFSKGSLASVTKKFYLTGPVEIIILKTAENFFGEKNIFFNNNTSQKNLIV